MKRILIAVVALMLFAGCSGNTTFVYKPAALVASGQRLPLRLAVLPFSDGTADFTVRGSVFTPENCTYNLAKTGIGGRITPLTPELWAKAFADDLAASGTYRSVRFVYGPSEITDEDFYIEGALKSADSSLLHLRGGVNRFALALRAKRKVDNGPVWEKDVAREWELPDTLFDGCGMNEQCRADRAHADTNRAMQALFAEAGADLAGTLSSLSGSRTSEGLPSSASPEPPQSQESVYETIEGILKGK